MSATSTGSHVLFDEDGNPIEGAGTMQARPAANTDTAAVAPGPTAWWRYGLVALAMVIAILLGMQLLSGNKGTDVIPGTPVAAPQNGVPVPVSR
jgi:hypothetical protein